MGSGLNEWCSPYSQALNTWWPVGGIVGIGEEVWTMLEGRLGGFQNHVPFPVCFLLPVGSLRCVWVRVCVCVYVCACACVHVCRPTVDAGNHSPCFLLAFSLAVEARSFQSNWKLSSTAHLASQLTPGTLSLQNQRYNSAILHTTLGSGTQLLIHGDLGRYTWTTLGGGQVNNGAGSSITLTSKASLRLKNFKKKSIWRKKSFVQSMHLCYKCAI